MDNMSVISIAFVSFPEALIVALLGIVSIGKFNYLKHRRNIITIIIYSLVSCLCTFFVRRFFHDIIEVSLISFLLICILFILIIRFKFYESVLSAIFGFSLFMISEILSVLLIASIANIKFDGIYTSDLHRIMLTLPERVIQITMIFLSVKYKFRIMDLETKSISKISFYVQLFVYLISIAALVFLAGVMTKALIFDHGNFMSTTNNLLLRINAYLSLFVILMLTLSIRGTHQFYRNKNSLGNNEFYQNLTYISQLIDNKQYDQAKQSILLLKTHIGSSDHKEKGGLGL